MISRLAQHHEMHMIKMTLCFTFSHLLELQGADFKAWNKKDIPDHMGRIIFMFNINDWLRAEPEVWLLLNTPSSGEAVSKPQTSPHLPHFSQMYWPDWPQWLCGIKVLFEGVCPIPALQLALEIALDFVQVDENKAVFSLLWV